MKWLITRLCDGANIEINETIPITKILEVFL